MESFISEFQQNRNVLTSLDDKDMSYDSLSKTKDMIIQYLKMLNLIKSKMNFGKEDFSVKIQFGWKDVLKNDFCYSYNINFEYYSILYNLAVTYYLIGNSISMENSTETKLKEAIKYFQYSAWIFDNIKNEVLTFMPPKETPYDMSSNYLTYVNMILPIVLIHIACIRPELPPKRRTKEKFLL